MQQHGPCCLRGPHQPAARWQQRSAAQPYRSRRPAIRTELVARVRREIAAGTYETPARLDAALERLLGRLGF